MNNLLVTTDLSPRTLQPNVVNLALFRKTTYRCSRVITEAYSTSFTLGIRMLGKRYHDPIYAVYGFVRYADEIVDTFHGYDKAQLLAEFRNETELAIERGISLNPVLNCFQEVVRQYNIEQDLIDAFLDSMAMDLQEMTYDPESYRRYIFGSAEAVGLMCLRVFCEGDEAEYRRLKTSAQALGSAFQKVNFLRDLKADYEERGRIYFPEVDFLRFDAQSKAAVEADIQADFTAGFEGICHLPKGSRLGVYVAYVYYTTLFRKIRRLPHTRILSTRVRVPNLQKLLLLLSSYTRYRVSQL